MKKILLTTALVAACSVSAFAQGTVLFQNNGSGYKALVYGGEPGNPTASKTGNTAAGLPAGSQTYGGALVGAGYRAQLFVAPGTVTDPTSSSFLTVSTINTFRTGGAAGVLGTLQVTVNGLAADAPQISMYYAAWDNSSGLYSDWSSARPAWQAGLIAAGFSPILTGGPAGGGANGAFTPVGIQSFNVYMVPEPATMALAGLGAAAVLIFRRRK